MCDVAVSEDTRSEPTEEEKLICDLQILDARLAAKMEILHKLDSTLNLSGGPAAAWSATVRSFLRPTPPALSSPARLA